ncbi:MAG: winged helix-turn-helix domain-containing protein, partial [Chloroflexi bacterium]|nr:winged helix-turn-helix domain-containing protein [Chloroflexota bacterium]
MEDILRTERETRKFRLLALLLLAAGVYFQRKEIDIWPALGLSLFYLVYLSFLLFTLIRFLPARILPYLMLVVDTGFAGGTLALFGVESAFFVFFPVLIIYYAIYLGYSGSFLSATLVSFAYIGIAYMQGANTGLLGRLLPMQIPLFYLIAVFSGYVAQRRLREQTERHELALLLQAERGARSMADLSVDLTAALDPDQLQRKMVQMAVSAAECTHGAIVLLDDSAGGLAPPVAMFPEGARIGPAKGGRAAKEQIEQARKLIQGGEPREIGSPEDEMMSAWAGGLSPSYVLLVPLVGNGAYRGVLWLLSATARESISPRQRELIGHLVGCFVPLIANAKAYATVRKESTRLSSELRGAVSQMARTQEMQKKGDARFGQLRLDAAQETAWFGSRRLELSAREFDVLYLLAKHGGRPVSQEVLLREVWGEQGTTRSNVVDVSINRLRRKLASQIESDDLVQTIRGVGYKLDSERAAMVEANGADGGKGSGVGGQSSGHKSHGAGEPT